MPNKRLFGLRMRSQYRQDVRSVVHHMPICFSKITSNWFQFENVVVLDLFALCGQPWQPAPGSRAAQKDFRVKRFKRASIEMPWEYFALGQRGWQEKCLHTGSSRLCSPKVTILVNRRVPKKCSGLRGRPKLRTSLLQELGAISSNMSIATFAKLDIFLGTKAG